MKILYHHRTASKDGQSTHITEMIHALRGAGHTVVEVAPSVANDNPSGGSPSWVGRLKSLLPRSVYELAELAYSCVASRSLAKAIAADRPDGIYERYGLYMLAGVWAKKFYGLPLILEINAPAAIERAQYGGLSWPRLASWLELYVWKHADALLPVTQVLADHMIERGVDSARVHVIPNAINPDHYREIPDVDAAKALAGLSGRLVVGFTGFVREWDRLDRIVAWVAKRAAEFNVHLYIVGDGPAREEIEACATQLGVADRVTFSGVVAREKVPSLAAAFDIALQTALVPYASPLCLFEYLALGKAIVAPDQANHRELLRPNEDAILYPPESSSGIEDALDTLVRDAQLRHRLSTAGPKLIVQRRLTWNEHAIRVVEIFSGLPAGAASPSPANNR